MLHVVKAFLVLIYLPEFVLWFHIEKFTIYSGCIMEVLSQCFSQRYLTSCSSTMRWFLSQNIFLIRLFLNLFPRVYSEVKGKDIFQFFTFLNS